jgi:hypothetical protein
LIAATVDYTKDDNIFFMSPSKRLIMHEGYNHTIQLRRRQKPDHDIGLVELEYIIQFEKNEFVKPVQLPYDYVDFDLSGETAELAGFGIYSEKQEEKSKDREYLRWINVRISSNKEVSIVTPFSYFKS